MPIDLRLINKTLLAPASLYVAINIGVSVVGFLKSMLFMRWLGMEELGIISLAQTIMSFISIFQIGLLNGGYRIFSLDRAEEQRNINNLIFSYIAVLTVVFLSGWGVLTMANVRLLMSPELLLVAIVCGLLMLTNNWLTNTLIGKRMLKELNMINVVSAGLSLLFLPLVAIWGLLGAILVLLFQPLVFVAVILVKEKELRPTAFLFDLKLTKYVLGFGFIPFLAGIFEIVNLQIERWSIASTLGTSALGDFYLVSLFYALFVLVPNSINNILFPQAVRAFDRKDIIQFKSIIKKQVLIMLLYDFLVIMLTFLLFKSIVAVLFPKHVDNVVYVYYYLPGLMAFSLCNVLSMIQNSVVRLKPMLISGLISIVLNAILVFTCYSLGKMSLINMSIIKSVLLIVSFSYMSLDLLYAKNKKLLIGGGTNNF